MKKITSDNYERALDVMGEGDEYLFYRLDVSSTYAYEYAFEINKLIEIVEIEGTPFEKIKFIGNIEDFD